MWLWLVPARRCHSAHHDQGQRLAQEQVRAEVISRLIKHPWPARSPDLSPLNLVLERGHNRAQKRPPTTTTTLVELKETIESFARSMDEEVKQAVQVPADELASVWSVTAPRLRRDSSGSDNVVLCRPLTVICVLKLKQ